jgi:hypothetical protein
VIHLGGTAAGRYDQLSVRGAATLAGTLSVVDVNGFVPHTGDRFHVLRARSVQGHFANPDPAFTFQYSATGLTLVKN